MRATPAFHGHPRFDGVRVAFENEGTGVPEEEFAELRCLFVYWEASGLLPGRELA